MPGAGTCAARYEPHPPDARDTYIIHTLYVSFETQIININIIARSYSLVWVTISCLWVSHSDARVESSIDV